MAFKGITFAGQNVTPKNDGGLYQAHYGDGILWGCSMAISGDDLVIQSGEFIGCGRVCQVDGATNVDLSTRTLTNGYIQVVMDFDISKPEGSQWNIHLPLIESATTTFPALTQDDINGTGTLYQVELAVVQISGGNLTSIYSTLEPTTVTLSVEVGGSEVPLAKMRGNIETLDGVPNVGIMELSRTDSDGNPLTGIFSTDKDIVVFANGQNIVFRPNGRDDKTNQVSIGAGGQLVDGLHTTLTESSTQQTISATGWQTVDSFSVGVGTWIVEAQYTFTPSTAGYVCSLQLSKGGATSDYVTGRTAIQTPNTSDTFGLNVFAVIQSSAHTSYTMHFYAPVAHTRRGYKLAITRLA